MPTQADIELVKSSASLRSVISEHVALKKTGASYVGLCPFHDESTPSFRVNQKFYYCFGCGASGDVFTFLSEFHSIPFPEAVRRLAYQCGITLSEAPVSRIESNYQKDLQAQFIFFQSTVNAAFTHLLHHAFEDWMGSETDQARRESHEWLDCVTRLRSDCSVTTDMFLKRRTSKDIALYREYSEAPSLLRAAVMERAEECPSAFISLVDGWADGH